MYKTYSMELGGRTLSVDIGRVGKQANGCAFMHNHLIFAFKETVHNKEYVADENIYNESDYQYLIDEIKKIMQDRKLMERKMEIQHNAAGVAERDHYTF